MGEGTNRAVHSAMLPPADVEQEKHVLRVNLLSVSNYPNFTLLCVYESDDVLKGY